VIDARDLLARPGGPVMIVERTSAEPSKELAAIASAAPWLSHSVIRREGALPTRVTVIGGRVEEIIFLGRIEGRMLEGLVLLLSELSQDRPNFETPATPALLRELKESRFITAVVSPTCPMCPAVLERVLRFPQASPYIKLVVARPEYIKNAAVRAVPTILLEGEPIATGVIGEYALAERVMKKR
jgi:hypothetical protein